jgi:hypothetical protein
MLFQEDIRVIVFLLRAGGKWIGLESIYWGSKNDGLVKSKKLSSSVIPAKTGIYLYQILMGSPMTREY